MIAGRLFGRLLMSRLPPLPSASKIYRPFLAGGIIGLGLVIAWLPPVAAALLLGGSIFLIFLLRRPILALYLLIPIIPFSAFLSVPLAEFKIGLMEIVLALGLMAWLLQLLVKSPGQPAQKLNLARPPAYLALPLLLFLGSIAPSWLNSLSMGASLVESIKWVEVLALYLLVVHLLPLGDVKWVVVVILLAGAAQATLGLYQFIFRVGPEGFLLFGGRFLRAYGSFAQPNPYAGYLGLILPLALSLTIWAFFGAVQSKAKRGQPMAWRNSISPQAPDFKLKFVVPVGLSLLLGLHLAALFASQSRGGWLAFAVAAVATVIAGSRKPGFIAGMLIAGVAIVGLVGAFDWRLNQFGPGGANTALAAVTQRFVDAANIISISDIASLEVTDANFATLERLAHWQAAREMWRDHPWLGAGFGNYAVIYPAYAVGRWLDPLGHAHNYLLNIGAEAGLAGLGGYLIFWISAFGVLWLAVRRSNGFYRAVAAGNFGILVHLHIHNLFDNLYVQGMYLHVGIVLAITSIICNAHNRKPN